MTIITSARIDLRRALSSGGVTMDGIARVLQELTADAAGRADGTHHVAIGRGAIGELGPWLQEHRPQRSHVIICDANTKAAAGDRTVAALRGLGLHVDVIVLDPAEGEDHLVCDDASVDQLASRLHPGVDPIAVGAGTINDIVKMAAARHHLPYQCVATAASMNGYTSAIAAVLSRGVKRTLPAPPAQAVFADVDVLCEAPTHLNLAGFGDLLSKPYSNADWRLSALVRDVPYADRPARLLDDAFELLLAHAEAIGASQPAGIEILAATIILSGFTMALAGTSAPASGGEHLVSHYWDMEQHCRHAPLHGLHGTQVGVATHLSALLFERLLELRPEDIDPDAAAARRPDASWLDGLPTLHPRLTPAVVEEVREQLQHKQRFGAALREEIASVKDRWPEIQAALADVLLPSRRIARALARAGAPDRPSRLGIGRDHAIRTLRVCRHIRSRYVALDLLDDLGLLETAAAEVVDAVEREY
jgi:glycerol-1-phosphate dehydrogenase [NAD(P)+]